MVVDTPQKQQQKFFFTKCKTETLISEEEKSISNEEQKNLSSHKRMGRVYGRPSSSHSSLKPQSCFIPQGNKFTGEFVCGALSPSRWPFFSANVQSSKKLTMHRLRR